MNLETKIKSFTRKIGQNKGRPRLWLEGDILTSTGFNHGDRWDFFIGNGYLTITNNPEGKRKIAGKSGRPIIDMTGKVLESANLADCKKVIISSVVNGTLQITRGEL